MFHTMRCKEHDHSSFFKFLQMEKNHKNTDCYFFYYSTCTKGDSCAYRHEPSALGCETVCSRWKQGSCLNQHCSFRHMEIKKNRKVIPCYWEKLPIGCKKPHCAFLHMRTRTGISNPIKPVKTGVAATTVPQKPAIPVWPIPDAKFDGNSIESQEGRGSSEADSYMGSPAVDPLIVNFEEESDSESAPSPTKAGRSRVSSCKTYEEIRLEEIQAESAAFYSYAAAEESFAGKMSAPTLARIQRLGASIYSRDNSTKDLDFQVLSLDEIRRRKRRAVVEAEKSSTDLKDAVKTLDELKVAIKEIKEPRKNKSLAEAEQPSAELKTEPVTRKKRSFAEVEPSAEEIKEPETRKRRSRSFVEAEQSGTEESPKKQVPPVRLRRHRRVNIKEEEKPAEAPKVESSVQERLEEKSASRRQSVEVRLCDSSTDDNQSTVVNQSTDVKSPEDKDQAVIENLAEIVSKQTKTCASEVKAEKSGLLTIDVEDDILKDIDALLTDDTSS